MPIESGPCDPQKSIKAHEQIDDLWDLWMFYRPKAGHQEGGNLKVGVELRRPKFTEWQARLSGALCVCMKCSWVSAVCPLIQVIISNAENCIGAVIRCERFKGGQGTPELPGRPPLRVLYACPRRHTSSQSVSHSLSPTPGKVSQP